MKHADPKTLEDYGIEILSGKLKPVRPMITVEVQCKLAEDPGLDGVRLKWSSRRKSELHFHGFRYEKEAQLLCFNVSEELPEYFKAIFCDEIHDNAPIVATTFPDFCWIHNAGTTSETAMEVDTPIQEYAILGDLTWLLPAKFADNLIDSVHLINSSFELGGLFGNAVLYGPFITAPSN